MSLLDATMPRPSPVQRIDGPPPMKPPWSGTRRVVRLSGSAIRTAGVTPPDTASSVGAAASSPVGPQRGLIPPVLASVMIHGAAVSSRRSTTTAGQDWPMFSLLSTNQPDSDTLPHAETRPGAGSTESGTWRTRVSAPSGPTANADTPGVGSETRRMKIETAPSAEMTGVEGVRVGATVGATVVAGSTVFGTAGLGRMPPAPR